MSSTGGFKISVEVKLVSDEVGLGVFSKQHIKAGTLLWTPSLVVKYTEEECAAVLMKMSKEDANMWLRQSYVLATEPSMLCVNQTDDGRFVNHSSQPNCGYASVEEPSVALREIVPGEELTCNYAGCVVYKIITLYICCLVIVLFYLLYAYWIYRAFNRMSRLGSPKWYLDLCELYDVMPTSEVARRYS